MKLSKAEIEIAIQQFRAIVPRDATLTVVSRGGAFLDVYYLESLTMLDGPPRIAPHWLSMRIAGLIGVRFNAQRECLSAGAIGMDRGRAIVSEVARVVYGNANALRSEWL